MYQAMLNIEGNEETTMYISNYSMYNYVMT